MFIYYFKAHFEDNPNDLKILRHDTTIHPARVQQHMKHIPSYLMPKIAPPSGVSSTQDDNEDLGYIPFRKNPRNPKRLSKNRRKVLKFFIKLCILSFIKEINLN